MSPTVVILLVGSIIAASCALVGTFLVLRQMALLGDAISHAVLPGIVIAFLVSHERTTLPMMLGAGALGVLTVFLVEISHRTRRLKEDASIGVVFPALFAIGVILVSRFAGQVDLDLDCVLYGEIAYTPWDLVFWNGVSLGPKALWVGGSVLLLNVLVIALFYKELKLTTFDASLAATLGFAPTAVHYLLMSLVSVTVVGAFESVGAILVVAMLVVPPATAYLLTDRLSHMLMWSVVCGVLSALGGYGVARWLDASIAGCMAVVAGLLFLLAFLLSPRHSLVTRLLRHSRLRRAMQEQLLLLHLDHGRGFLPMDAVTRRFSWSRRQLSQTVERLRRRGWLELEGDGLQLTPAGAQVVEHSDQAPLRHVLEGHVLGVEEEPSGAL